MIRKFKIDDLSDILQIWLDTNIKAHSFINKKYWVNNFELVKEMLPNAEIYVYEHNNNKIKGFIGLDNGYIAGIFVCDTYQSQGIGKKLLNKVKEIYPVLSLNVYEKNNNAIKFYKREGFVIKEKQTDKNNNEIEYVMTWKR